MCVCVSLPSAHDYPHPVQPPPPFSGIPGCKCPEYCLAFPEPNPETLWKHSRSNICLSRFRTVQDPQTLENEKAYPIPREVSRRESSGGMEWLGVWNCIFSGPEFSNFGAWNLAKIALSAEFRVFPANSGSEKYFSDSGEWPFLAGHGEMCPPTWVIHMATRRPAHNPPIHIDFLYGFLWKAPSPCGSACCGLVCGSPCGSPMWVTNFAMACRKATENCATPIRLYRFLFARAPPLRGPEAILFILRDTCNNSIAKCFCACSLGVSHKYRAICCKMGYPISHWYVCVKEGTKGGYRTLLGDCCDGWESIAR